MANTLEFNISIKGMEAAIAEVTRLGKHAQDQLDKLKPPSAGGAVPSGPVAASQAASRYRSADAAREAAMRSLNPTNQLEKRYWLNKFRNDDRLFREQERLVQRQKDRENRLYADRLRSAGTMANRAVMGAGAAIAGATAVGFVNTVEGNRLKNEIWMISRELAGIFKPTMDYITEKMGGVRHWFQRLSPEGQDALQYGLEAAAVGYGAYRTGALGLGMAGMGWAGRNIGYGRLGLYGAAAYSAGSSINTLFRGRDNYERQKALTDGADFTQEERDKNKDLNAAFDMSPMERKRFLDEQYRRADSDHLAQLSQKKSRTLVGMAFSAAGINPWRGTGQTELNDVATRQKLIARMLSDSEFQRTGFDPANPNRRRVLDTSTVGFGAVGSTAEMLQEEALKVTADNAPKTGKAPDPQLEAIRQAIEKTNEVLKALDPSGRTRVTVPPAPK